MTKNGQKDARHKEIMMDNICKSLRGWGSYCIHITALPLFFIYFILVFDPNISADFSFRELYGEHYTMNLLLLAAILLGTESLVRMIYTFLCRSPKVRMSLLGYLLWCLMESVVAALFWALYSCLMLKAPYLQCFFTGMRMALAINGFTYLITALSLTLHDAPKAGRATPEEDTHLIRFQDYGKRLKLVIAPSALLYLESDENYVNIWYMDAGRLKKFVLRNSMKALEEMTGEHGLKRCHRRFIVNPSHIKVLRKEPEGVILAEMDINGVQPIPVSKRFYESISDLL